MQVYVASMTKTNISAINKNFEEGKAIHGIPRNWGGKNHRF